MSKFKIGDKVKIPKTKSISGNINSSNVVNRAKDLKQDYLFITEIDGNIYTLLEIMNTDGWGGDFFAKEDLEHYTKTTYIKTDKPFEIVEQSFKGKIKYKVMGNKTTVKVDGKTACAKCCPDDTFSLYEGIRIAIARVFGVDPFPNSEKTVNEEKEIIEISEENFKIGDYIYYIFKGQFCTCKIEKIEDNKLYGKWNSYDKGFDRLPATVREFDLATRYGGLEFMYKEQVTKFNLAEENNLGIKITIDTSEALKLIDELSEKLNALKVRIKSN